MITHNIAVLITCHNRKNKTLDCLKALYACSLPDRFYFDVFLVDDGSTDGTGTQVKQQFPEINVIDGDGQLFWNRGMYLAWNTAVKKKEYAYYFWLNDDTILFENALNILLSKTSENYNQILVGATKSFASDKTTYTGYIFPKQALTVNGSWQSCDYFNGNIVLIPKIIQKDIGLLDNKFRHALGDFDYGLRAKEKGYIHMLAPIFLGYCEGHEIEPKWRNKKVSLITRIRYLYSPLGNNPFEFFIYDKRHLGLYTALFHFFTIHLRTLLPRLWRTN